LTWRPAPAAICADHVDTDTGGHCADIPAITAIYTDAVRFGTASFEIDPPDAAEMGERFAVLAAGGFPYLVAATDTGIAGYAYAGPYRTRVAYRNTVEDSVYLGPQFHRRRLIPLAQVRLYVVGAVGAARGAGWRVCEGCLA
jgi:hypothetical protein